MYLHHCRFFQEQVRILLQSLRALCKAPGVAGSIWKYLEALARNTGVSGGFAYRFRTELHLADDPTFHRSLLHTYSVPFAVCADCSSSRLIETMLTILYPLSPDPHPGSMRWCSQYSTAACTRYSPLQPSRPGLTRRCSLSRVLRAHTFIPVQRDGAHSSSLILHACQIRLTSISSGCASRSCILQMHPPQVSIAVGSSKCASHS